MSTFSAIVFLKYVLRYVLRYVRRYIRQNVRRYLWQCATLMVAFAGFAVQAQPASNEPTNKELTNKEPIAYIGHGAMFNQNGQEVPPSLEFIRESQAWYRNNLVAKLNRKQKAQFEKYERSISGGLTLDEQSRLLANAHLLDWLIDTTKVANGGRIRGKNILMKRELQRKLPEKSVYELNRKIEPYAINPALQKRIDNLNIKKSRMLTTNTGGPMYRTLCEANGVPIPPDFGPTSEWIRRGTIPQNQLFIVAGFQAEVMTYQSPSPGKPTNPPGMCVALPRFDGTNTVQLDGVICLGQVSSKVCFWDNEKNGSAFTFPLGGARPFSDFGGGNELLGDVKLGGGGVCSDCHAGENPYIIHPNTVLGRLKSGEPATATTPAIAPLPTFANAWYDPIVRTGDVTKLGAPLIWPENPGPMNSPPSCISCHARPGSGGRLPHLSTALPGYCGILRAAIGALPPSANNPLPTMPQGSPGSLAPGGVPNTEMTRLLNWCGSAATGDASGRGDPHITTSNRINYDFQSAGEFTYLRAGNGLEIQVRQTPVSTATAIGPDAHTGLTSCVSVNTAVAARVGKHRVSYQPNFNAAGERVPLELRVDGKLMKVGPKGINFGGGARLINSAVGDGIEINFPDKTRLIVTSNWWDSQRKWYLDVEVFNTIGRDGIMGAITPGEWLPALPDGSTFGPIPASLNQRYIDLNQKFADAWRVDKSTSLFDYAPGMSTDDFTDKAWPPEKPPCIVANSRIPPAEPMDPRKAKKLCDQIVDKNMNAQCVFDLTVTGELSFLKAYMTTQQLKLGKTGGKIVGAKKSARTPTRTPA